MAESADSAPQNAARGDSHEGENSPTALLDRVLESGRIHSAFLLSGAGDAPREAAHTFARGLVCRGDGPKPCEACRDCQLSAEDAEAETIEIDGAGKSGPLYRHIGDHSDLYWVDRGEEGTRVRIGQVRAVKNALRLASNEGGWRCLVIADAEWLNDEAQNAILKLLEEPPAQTCIVLVTASPAGLLATIRSRCQKVAFNLAGRPSLRGDDAPEEVRAIAERLDAIERLDLNSLLDWAEEYRGARALAAPRVQTLVTTGAEWVRERVTRQAETSPQADVHGMLEAFRALNACRKDLAQRNANPQMVAERALLAMRKASPTR